ncbi:MAG: 50S ribosomal protein L9 [Candidatus Cloacimonetes bacterium]|jgi:large subunit ribosomal protein L9|nr:50S ribosomal protein L9 [Candidatus Cloacimonadota bacterium]MBT6993392.1 50S ribosomal protein L9 [Candidatus Cloacimonadota bacterium]
MKIILASDIASLGQAGDIVNVANGYARNYLLPQNLAVLATKGNLSRIEKIKKEAEIKRLVLENEYKALAKQIEGVELSFTRKADDDEHLFGSVSEFDIVNALAEKGIQVQKRNVHMKKHLKEVGEFEVVIHLAAGIETNIKIKVDKE